MSIEGKLRIELECRENRVSQVRIRSSRPLQLPLLFEGKPVEEVLQTIPLLYSICATAQASAAAGACRQAVGVEVEPGVLLGESMLLWLETAREHLCRVLIDWPGYLGEPPNRAQLPGFLQLLPDAKSALFDETGAPFTLQPRLRPQAETLARLIERLSQILERSVFGMTAEEWSALDTLAPLERWIEGRQTLAARYLDKMRTSGVALLGQTTVESLPKLDDSEFHERLQADDADEFVAAPEWTARARETSCLTRQAQHPLIVAMEPVYGRGMQTRLVARLLELAAIPAHLKRLLQLIGEETAAPDRGDSTPVSGMGLGVVEAARGRLVHRARTSGHTIEGYQILAPTEWNFHPRGLVAEGLLGLPCTYQSTMREQASLFISAVDPCVGYSFEFV